MHSCTLSIATWGILILISVISVLLVILKIYNKISFKWCTSNVQLHGKTVIVTGASAGVGKEAAKDFAKRGAKVILACRNKEKAQRIADEIIEYSKNKNVFVRHLDTSLMSSVRAFAKETLEKETRIDILVLNAGIAGLNKRTLTMEGLEMVMATNHFGHFLLVNLLSGLLRKSAPCRIVVTSSQGHMAISKINPKDLNFENEKYGGFRAYCLSKLCNVMMTRYLAVYFQNKGITANCLCPGFVQTEIFHKTDSFFLGTASYYISKIAARTEEEGAQTIIHLAVSEDVKDVSGAFFMDCKERKFNHLANDAGLIKKIWEASEDIVKLTATERSTRVEATLK